MRRARYPHGVGAGGSRPVRRRPDAVKAQQAHDRQCMTWRSTASNAATADEQDALGPCPGCGRSLGQPGACSTCCGLGR